MKEDQEFQCMVSDDKSSKKRREIKKKYWLIVLGVILLFCGYTSYLILQSSVRIEDGKGVKITMATYACQISISMLLAPLILRLFGAKKALITAECSYIFFAFANAFSNPVLLYLGAIFAAYAEAVFWLPIGISFVFFAQKYKRFSSKPLSDCVMEFCGMMFAAFQLNFVVGNLFISLILFIFESLETPISFSNTTLSNTTQSTPQTRMATEIDIETFGDPIISRPTLQSTNVILQSQSYDRFHYCGSNDCQNPNITQENIDQYVPKNPIALYVLSGCLLILMISGMTIHILFFPNMPLSLLNNTKTTAVEENKQEANDFQKDENKLKKIILLSFKTVKDTIFLLFHPKQFFLVNPVAIYLGINTGFILFEITRAFASCVLRVSQVGVCMIIEATANSAHAFLVGKIFGKRGRAPLIVFGALLDVGIYSFCLLWRPTEETSWGVYVLFFVCGISNATWQMILATMFGSDFYKSKEISFNLWCITFALGYFLQLSVSTFLCVSTKLYCGIVWVIIAAIAAVISEKLNSRRMKKVLTSISVED